MKYAKWIGHVNRAYTLGKNSWAFEMARDDGNIVTGAVLRNGTLHSAYLMRGRVEGKTIEVTGTMKEGTAYIVVESIHVL